MLRKIPELVSEARTSLNVITAQDAATRVKEVNGVVIDVRELVEAEKKPVQGVINIPRGVLEPQIVQRFPDENLPLFLHCASGVRATFAAEQLLRLGYKHVAVISCAIDDVCQSFG